MKKRILASLSLVAIISICQGQNIAGLNSLSREQKKEGWQLLFNGANTNGWHSYGQATVSAHWRVAYGVLLRDTSGATHGKESKGSDLVTNGDYKNFHLKLEWKISRNGNSGVVFLLKEDTAMYPNTYNTGYEMQIFDMESTTHIPNRKHDTGDLYDLIPASKGAIKPQGEWNASEIILNNGKIDFFLNGVKVLSTVIWDEKWKRLVAGSKFASMEDFGTFRQGKIALQDHGDGVYYRNIMIRKLP